VACFNATGEFKRAWTPAHIATLYEVDGMWVSVFITSIYIFMKLLGFTRSRHMRELRDLRLW